MQDMLLREALLDSQIGCAYLITKRDSGGQIIDMQINRVNKAIKIITGMDEDYLYNKSLFTIFPDFDSIIDNKYNIKFIDYKETNIIKYKSNSNNIILDIFILKITNEENVALVFNEISAIDNTGSYSQLNLKIFETIMSSVSDGIIAADIDGRIIFINDVASDMIEWDVQTAIGMHINNVFNVLDYKTHNKCDCFMTMAKTTKQKYSPDSDCVLISRLGIERVINFAATPLFDANNTFYGFVLTFRDITQEKHKLEAIEYLSYHDVLTGLYNRTFYEAELKRLDTQRNYPLTVIVADLNSLKLINDAFGHSQGDYLLRKAGEVLRYCCRADDIIARIGGDEFVILLPKTNSQDAERIIDRIKELCKQTSVCSINLSISFGFESKLDKDESIRETQKRAENNMYRQKLFESTIIKGDTVKSIITALYGTHSREEEHSKNVSRLCELIGHELCLDETDLKNLITTSLMHDIGKIATDVEIEQKLDPLTAEDWMDIKRHPEIGYRILRSVKDMTNIAESVLSHHERWDGNGYPRGLKGEAIPLFARIISIADAYDAMTSNRAFRRNKSSDEAIQEIMLNAGTQFDPKLAEIFNEIYKKTSAPFIFNENTN